MPGLKLGNPYDRGGSFGFSNRESVPHLAFSPALQKEMAQRARAETDIAKANAERERLALESRNRRNIGVIRKNFDLVRRNFLSSGLSEQEADELARSLISERINQPVEELFKHLKSPGSSQSTPKKSGGTPFPLSTNPNIAPLDRRLEREQRIQRAIYGAT